MKKRPLENMALLKIVTESLDIQVSHFTVINATYNRSLADAKERNKIISHCHGSEDLMLSK